MNKIKIIQKTLVRLSEMRPTKTQAIINVIKENTDSEFIYKYLYRVLKESKSSQEEIKVLFERMLRKEKLQDISSEHKDAFKRILNVFPFVEITV